MCPPHTTSGLILEKTISSSRQDMTYRPGKLMRRVGGRLADRPFRLAIECINVEDAHLEVHPRTRTPLIQGSHPEAKRTTRLAWLA